MGKYQLLLLSLALFSSTSSYVHIGEIEVISNGNHESKLKYSKKNERIRAPFFN